MTAHEYATAVAKTDNVERRTAAQRSGYDQDGNSVVMRSRHAYREAYDLYCEAQTWAATRSIGLTGSELVRVYTESRLIPA